MVTCAPVPGSCAGSLRAAVQVVVLVVMLRPWPGKPEAPLRSPSRRPGEWLLRALLAKPPATDQSDKENSSLPRGQWRDAELPGGHGVLPGAMYLCAASCSMVPGPLREMVSPLRHGGAQLEDNAARPASIMSGSAASARGSRSASGSGGASGTSVSLPGSSRSGARQRARMASRTTTRGMRVITGREAPFRAEEVSEERVWRGKGAARWACHQAYRAGAASGCVTSRASPPRMSQ